MTDAETIAMAVVLAIAIVSLFALMGWVAWLDSQKAQRPRAPEATPWTWQVTTTGRPPSDAPAGSQGDYDAIPAKPQPSSPSSPTIEEEP